MKILIADDSRVMRMIVLRALRDAGYGDADIIQAENGAQALTMVASERPNLILSDWNMPEMTGIEFLENLRADGDKTPFGFVTSESSPHMRHLAVEAGAMFLISKPFTPEAFKTALAPVAA